MHHWGPKELVVGAGYRLKHQSDNSFDRNATAIFDEPNRKAYLKRHDAKTVSSVFKVISGSNWLPKSKEIPVVLSQRVVHNNDVQKAVELERIQSNCLTL